MSNIEKLTNEKLLIKKELHKKFNNNLLTSADYIESMKILGQLIKEEFIYEVNNFPYSQQADIIIDVAQKLGFKILLTKE